MNSLSHKHLTAMAVLMVCLVSGCQKDCPTGIDIPGKVSVEITAGMSTRTHLEGDKAVWSEEPGTAFAVVQTYGYLYFPVMSSGFSLDAAGQPVIKAELSDSGASKVFAIYPYNALVKEKSTSSQNNILRLSEVQRPSEGTFDEQSDILVSSCEEFQKIPASLSLGFRRITAFARLRLTGMEAAGTETVKAIDFGADGIALAGEMKFNAESGELALSAPDTMITLRPRFDAHPDSGLEAVFCCFPSEIPEGHSWHVRVTTDKSMYTKHFNSGSFTFRADSVTDINVDMSGARKIMNAPFGWATCKSLTDNSHYEVTGGSAAGENAKKIILKSSGAPMDQEIKKAIEDYDIIVLDGSNGKFLFDEVVDITVNNRTIFGINNAVCETVFYLTPEIKAMFDAYRIMSMTKDEGEYNILPNGKKANRFRHYFTRKLLMEYTGDYTEHHLKAGFFNFNTCENIIIRNIRFTGGGTYSLLENYSNIRIRLGSKHVWVDHCLIEDGCDGNFDCGGASDLITVTWSHFQYGERSYATFISNLNGSAEYVDSDEGHLNSTYAYCRWPDHPDSERVPHCRYGQMHVLNCYYPMNRPYSNGIQGGYHSCFLIENNYFDIANHFYRFNEEAYAYMIRGNRTPGEGQKGSVNPDMINIPYEYPLYDAELVKDMVCSRDGAGPTLDLHKNSY